MIPSPLWTAEEIIRAVRGHCLQEQNWNATGVSIDSRFLVKGDVFIALQGPVHDGHDHVAAAFAAGAAAAIVSRQPAQTPGDSPLIFVEDTFVALQDLGRAGRDRAQGKIIAVTGSVGKTSTKEMLRLSLSAVGKTYANRGSFNNHWGVPLALASLPADAAYGVFELGMNHAGELAALSALARPDIALITTIEAVHLEFFASTEAIADAKAEIFDGMQETGIVVLNRDNPHSARLASAAKSKGIKKILYFSSTGKSDAQLIDSVPIQAGRSVNALLLGHPISYTLGASGMHLVQNSLGALLTATLASGKAEDCAAALASYTPPKGRGVCTTIHLPQGGRFTLIDESYNASPPSVRAALRVLADTPLAGYGRRIVVLGDMRELGVTTPDLHAALAEDIQNASIDKVFCCGEMMRFLYDALPENLRGVYVQDSATLAPLVAAQIRGDDVVTVKGSNSMKLALVVEAIKAAGVLSPSLVAS